MSTAFAGGFLTTGPPGKAILFFKKISLSWLRYRLKSAHEVTTIQNPPTPTPCFPQVRENWQLALRPVGSPLLLLLLLSRFSRVQLCTTP